jgi:F0F1-type ATP synthase assembly protein I
VAAIELPGLKRVAYGAVIAQASLTAAIALLCLARWGRYAALSAAIGGGIGVAASLTLALFVFRKGKRELADVVRAFYVGEAAKIAVVVILFVVVLATLKKMLVPGALFAAYVATFLAHWVALRKAMPKLEGK